MGFSDSTLKRYRNDIKKQSPNRRQPTNHKRSQILSNDSKTPQMTSKESVIVSAKFIMSANSGSHAGSAN